MDLLIKLFDVLFPVFLTIGIGYWYGKKDPKFDTKFITTFAGNFGLPAIIFYSFTTTNLSIELFLRFSYYITLGMILLCKGYYGMDFSQQTFQIFSLHL